MAPALVSDGAGLPFALALLYVPDPPALYPDDPAVATLLAGLLRRQPGAGPQALRGWRSLARTDGEALFGRGRPPELTTVAVRRDARRGEWSILASSTGRPLRAARDGVRASSWRPDPDHPPQPSATEVRILITEQTHASGKLAHGRHLPPEIHLGAAAVTLRCFVAPLPGWQNRNVKNPETPAVIALPEPLGARELKDGALYAPDAATR